MNVFSRIKKGIVGAFGGRMTRSSEQPTVSEDRKGRLRFQAPPRMVKLWHNNGRPIFGPATTTDRAEHHLSRQTCRAYLRSRFFAAVSEGNKLMSRRDRRRAGRLFAKLEYRRMMADPTNAIDPQEEALFKRLEKRVAA